jgi:hypothetical protein
MPARAYRGGMRASWGLLCLVSCAAAQLPSEPSPSPSGTASADVALEILPVGSATAPEPAAPSWKVGGVLQHMPARCDFGRAYMNLDELLATGSAALLAKLTSTKVPVDADGKAALAVMRAFEKAGKNPYSAVKEVAFCFEKSNDTSVVALRIDLAGVDKPAEIVAKAVADSQGKAPKVESAGAFVWVEHREGRVVAVGENLILFGHSRKAVESGAAGGATDFADAARHVVWVRIREKESLVKLSAIGDDFDFQLEMHHGPGAASIVSTYQAMLPTLERMIDDPKLAMLKPLMPAARRASIQASGEQILVSTRMPKTVVREVLQGLVDSPGFELEGGL